MSNNGDKEKIELALLRLEHQYPYLHESWCVYCRDFHRKEPYQLPLALLKLWLEKRHPEFGALLESENAPSD
jgi:hypothetical protein